MNNTEKQKLFAEIDKYGQFSDEDKEIILEINRGIMNYDGTAEGWGYECDPIDYLEGAMEIFILTKRYFLTVKCGT